MKEIDIYKVDYNIKKKCCIAEPNSKIQKLIKIILGLKGCKDG